MPLHARRLAVVVVAASVGCVAYLFLLSLAIGFSVPFMMVQGSVAWAPIILGLFVFYFGKLYRENQQFRIDLGNYMCVYCTQISMTFVYPTYVYGFNAISPSAQKFYVLLLPIVKIMFKNSISHFLGELDDLKSEVVIFNALYVSSCMQASISTSFMVLFVDGLQAFVSLREIWAIQRKVNHFTSRIPPNHSWYGKHFIGIALAIIEEDSFVKNHPSLRTSCLNSDRPLISFRPRGTVTLLTNHRYNTQGGPLVSVGVETPSITSCQSNVKHGITKEVAPITGAAAQVRNLDSSRTTSSGVGNYRIRLQFVQNVPKLLFMSEFVMLIEYTEVTVPVIYCVRVSIQSIRASPPWLTVHIILRLT